MDCSLPVSSVHEISQARILEGLPFPPLGDLPHPGMEPASLTSNLNWQASSLPLALVPLEKQPTRDIRSLKILTNSEYSIIQQVYFQDLLSVILIGVKNMKR